MTVNEKRYKHDIKDLLSPRIHEIHIYDHGAWSYDSDRRSKPSGRLISQNDDNVFTGFMPLGKLYIDKSTTVICWYGRL